MRAIKIRSVRFAGPLSFRLTPTSSWKTKAHCNCLDARRMQAAAGKMKTTRKEKPCRQNHLPHPSRPPPTHRLKPSHRRALPRRAVCACARNCTRHVIVPTVAAAVLLSWKLGVITIVCGEYRKSDCRRETRFVHTRQTIYSSNLHLFHFCAQVNLDAINQISCAHDANTGVT